MIIVTGSITAREGCLDEALALSLQHVARSRAEPGCMAHAVHVDAEHPRRLVFLEEWADMAALEQHFAVLASRVFAKALSSLAEGAPQLRIFDAQAIRR